jgi:hypothetical protein
MGPDKVAALAGDRVSEPAAIAAGIRYLAEIRVSLVMVERIESVAVGAAQARSTIRHNMIISGTR